MGAPRRLATYITTVRTGAGNGKSVEEDHAAMWAMVDKWASKVIQREASEQVIKPASQTIVRMHTMSLGTILSAGSILQGSHRGHGLARCSHSAPTVGLTSCRPRHLSFPREVQRGFARSSARVSEHASAAAYGRAMEEGGVVRRRRQRGTSGALAGGLRERSIPDDCCCPRSCLS